MQRRNMNFLWPVAALVVLLFASCKPPQNRRVPEEGKDDPTALDEKAIVPLTSPAEAFPYRPSETKTFDLVHTMLQVRFNWEKEEMEGQATLTMLPWFLPTQELVLDAKGFVLHRVALMQGNNITNLRYTYDNERIRIDLGRPYTRSETLQVKIDYTARPWILDSLVSEPAAEDQGLYFINPRGEIPGKPRQVWTQGESHGSPGWFPTFDTPNQRCTQETYITVGSNFQTLCNGKLVSSNTNPDGTRTDCWRMDQPHAPYLFMMAIGEYAVVRDHWRDREVNYYVEPAYEPYARLVFGETPAMMEFFSQRLGVDYPWAKYSQVVVRDFVSGAMENTTATTHYGRLQHNAREHLDDPQEDIIAHELFHQWFGDLVTCESWANLSLNEGFATYGEFLWNEHRHGRDHALASHLGDRNAYLRQASRVRYPIIRYHHPDADAMFDAHSYQKGGQVLHMLRVELGDELFFAGLRHYLTTNAYDDVEIHELRLSMEEVSGMDLNWFFDQWFLKQGHPELELQHSYAEGKYMLHVKQVQDPAGNPTFRIPVVVDYVVGEKHQLLKAWMSNRDSTFTFPVDGPPSHIAFNPDASLLCAVRSVNGLGSDQWLHQVVHGQNFAQRSEALAKIVAKDLSTDQHAQLLTLSRDPYEGVRRMALDSLGGFTKAQATQAIPVALQLLADPKSKVREEAAGFLGLQASAISDDLRTPALAALRKAVRDSSYSVGNSALVALNELDGAIGLAMAEEMMNTTEKHLSTVIAIILKQANSPKALPFILARLEDKEGSFSVKTSLLRGLGGWLLTRPETEMLQGRSAIMRVANEDKERWVRFFAIQALGELKEQPEVKAFLQKRATEETDEFVRSIIQKFINEE